MGYTPEYVERLFSVARRRYEGEMRTAVLTDQPDDVDADEVIRVQTPPHRFPWWAKVELFKPDRFRGRVCYLDLDTLPVRSLNPITDYPAPFALVPHAGQFEGKNGLKVVKRYNSSAMVWDAGHANEIYTDFDESVRKRLWGDQDWIGEKMPYERKMPLAWFPRLSEFDAASGQLPADARVILCKQPKNSVAAERWPWFRDAWR